MEPEDDGRRPEHRDQHDSSLSKTSKRSDYSIKHDEGRSSRPLRVTFPLTLHTQPNSKKTRKPASHHDTMILTTLQTRLSHQEARLRPRSIPPRTRGMWNDIRRHPIDSDHRRWGNKKALKTGGMSGCVRAGCAGSTGSTDKVAGSMGGQGKIVPSGKTPVLPVAKCTLEHVFCILMF